MTTIDTGRNKFQGLEITAKQVVPGKMYTLPPVVTPSEEPPSMKNVACEQSTSMTPTEFKDIIDPIGV